MTWFELIKSTELKEFEILAEKYAEPTDLKHLDYLRKKHGKKSNEFYDSLNKQIGRYLSAEEWSSIQDIIKSLREQNPGLKDTDENLTAFLRNRLDKMDIKTKQERGAGRTGKKTFYKV
tara:strand:- start:1433 stop:1789 length:357 start_codon:yes stop_codon:yes gene_type:complete